MDLPEVNATTAIVGLIGVILSMISGVAGYMIKREGRIGEVSGIVTAMKISLDDLKKETAVIEADVKLIKRDVDGLAMFVGTPRALATKKALEDEKGKPID